MRGTAKILAWTAVAVVIGWVLYRSRIWQKSGDDQPKYETTTVDRGPIIAKVTASGTLSALVTVQVGSQVSGRIKEILADYNSVVKKGQIIAKLDPQLLTATLEQARANYEAATADQQRAEAQALDANRQLARQRSLNERKLTAQADFDTAQANAAIAEAEVASARGRVAQMRAALHQAQVNLDYATIESPIDGVVISRSVDVGQTVAASLQTPTLFVIAENLHKMQVDTSVAEADVGKLKPGMTATFTVDAYPNEHFEGSVRQIRNAATTVQNVVTYDAVIDVENPQLLLRPGMTANVTFIYAEKNDALRTLNAALRFKPTPDMLEPHDGNSANGASDKGPRGASTALTSTQPRPKRDEQNTRRTLWVLKNKRPEPVSVRIGITDGTHTELLDSELEEGARVITDITGTSTNASPQNHAPGRGGPGGGFRRIL